MEQCSVFRRLGDGDGDVEVPRRRRRRGDYAEGLGRQQRRGGGDSMPIDLYIGDGDVMKGT